MEDRYHDDEYLNLVSEVLHHGTEREDRTGTGTIGLFGKQMSFDLTNGSIPLLTTKKMHTRSIIIELLWYLRGETNIKYLQDNGVRIWNEWADDNGDLGPIYGEQWRKVKAYRGCHIDYQSDPPQAVPDFDIIDQVADAINKIKTNPTDRRIIINSWNVAEIENMKLPPCHLMYQFWVNGDELSCKMIQRSVDVGLGLPFNIVQYAILTHMFAQVCGLKAKEFIWSGGDVHIYKNHVDQLKGQTKLVSFPSPTLKLNPDIMDIDGFSFEDFEIVGYEHHPLIKMDVSV